MPWINVYNCTECMICAEVCPVGAVRQKNDGRVEIVQSVCTDCGECVTECPQEAVLPNSLHPDIESSA